MVEELFQYHVMMDQAIVLRVVTVWVHRLVHRRRKVLNLISVCDQRPIVLLQAAKHQLHMIVRQIALLRLVLRVIHNHLDAVLDLLEAHIQLVQLLQVLRGTTTEKVNN